MTTEFDFDDRLFSEYFKLYKKQRRAETPRTGLERGGQWSTIFQQEEARLRHKLQEMSPEEANAHIRRRIAEVKSPSGPNPDAAVPRRRQRKRQTSMPGLHVGHTPERYHTRPVPRALPQLTLRLLET